MKKLLRFLAKRSASMTAGFVITGLAVANVLGHLPSDVVERLDYLIYDIRLRADVVTPENDDRIIIVDIDEKSLKEVGRWPWSRSTVADMVTELVDNLGAAVVAFDVVFAEPEQSDAIEAINLLKNQSDSLKQQIQPYEKSLKQVFDRDAQFAEVISQRPVVLGYYFNQNPDAVSGALPAPLFKRSQLGDFSLQSIQWKGFGANLYKLQRVADGGYFNPLLDSDGTIRSVPLLAEFEGGFYQSLALATLRTALGNPQVIPIFPAGVPDDYGALETIALRSAEIELDIPIQRGLLSLINYRARGGPEGGGYRYISAADVLAGKLNPEEVQGRIILVGTTAPGLLDLRSTPVNPAFPGVEVHANMLSSMLDGEAKLQPEFAKGLVLISVVAVGLAMSFLLPFLSATWSMVLSFGVLAASIGLNSWLYYEQNLVLPVAVVLLVVLSIFVFDVAYGYLAESRTKRQMVNLFGEYVAPELVTEMADNPKGYSMEGESRYLSVLFSDVRGFTTISESLEPNDLREYINEYLTCMSEIIRGQRGTLDKYIGDAIMAFWGAPIPDEAHAEYAIRAGLAMLDEVEHLNARLEKRGWPALAIGIGINTGQMRVGDMGSKIRRAYTVMGDAVNLGSRLEGITKTYGVGLIVGESTQEQVPHFVFKELDKVRVKGKDEPVAIYQPFGPSENVTGEQHKTLLLWSSFLKEFRAQQWDEAQALLNELKGLEGEQILYDLYANRIEVFKADPPGADWDGVTKFDTK